TYHKRGRGGSDACTYERTDGSLSNSAGICMCPGKCYPAGASSATFQAAITAEASNTSKFTITNRSAKTGTANGGTTTTTDSTDNSFIAAATGYTTNGFTTTTTDVTGDPFIADATGYSSNDFSTATTSSTIDGTPKDATSTTN